MDAGPLLGYGPSINGAARDDTEHGMYKLNTNTSQPDRHGGDVRPGPRPGVVEVVTVTHRGTTQVIRSEGFAIWDPDAPKPCSQDDAGKTCRGISSLGVECFTRIDAGDDSCVSCNELWVDHLEAHDDC